MSKRERHRWQLRGAWAYCSCGWISPDSLFDFRLRKFAREHVAAEQRWAEIEAMTPTNPTPGDLRQVRAAGERSEK